MSLLYVTSTAKDQVLHVHKSLDNGATWQEVFTRSLLHLADPDVQLARALLMGVAAKTQDAVVTWMDQLPGMTLWQVLAAKESTSWTVVMMNVQAIALVDPTTRALRDTFGDYMVPAYTDTKVTVIAGRRGTHATIPDVYVLQV